LPHLAVRTGEARLAPTRVGRYAGRDRSSVTVAWEPPPFPL